MWLWRAWALGKSCPVQTFTFCQWTAAQLWASCLTSLSFKSHLQNGKNSSAWLLSFFEVWMTHKVLKIVHGKSSRASSCNSSNSICSSNSRSKIESFPPFVDWGDFLNGSSKIWEEKSFSCFLILISGVWRSPNKIFLANHSCRLIHTNHEGCSICFLTQFNYENNRSISRRSALKFLIKYIHMKIYKIEIIKESQKIPFLNSTNSH